MPASKPRRSKRDPELVRRLDEVRQVMKVRRTEAQRRATATMDAVETYLHAAGVIRKSLAVRDQRIGELRQQIEKLEREHEAEAARWRARQASAIEAIRDQGESDDSIGQLLELTGRQVRQLMAAAARAAEQKVGSPAQPGMGAGPGSPVDVIRAEFQNGSQADRTVIGPIGQSFA
ncbi:hypothetical protein ACWF9G_27325 [Nocardia sp. NPDC055029]